MDDTAKERKASMYKNIYKDDEMKRAEHMAVRTSVGWYLWTHQLVKVTGEDVTDFLDYMLTGNIKTLTVGRDRYTTMLNEAGEIIDDVVVFRMAEKEYWLSTLFATKMDDWFFDHQGNYDVDWEDITEEWHMFSVQGPKAKEVLNEIVSGGVEDLKFFAHGNYEVRGIPVMVNRGGYTGAKWGYEIYVAPDQADDLEAVLKDACERAGGRQVTEFQVMAWTLPTEAGFYYMKDIAHNNPFEVGLSDSICWEKEFIGKKALLKVKEEGAKREMLGFICLEDDYLIKSRHLGGAGEAIYMDGYEEEVARVVKLVYSYVKNVNNGYLLARKGVFKTGDHFRAHGHECVITEKKWM